MKSAQSQSKLGYAISKHQNDLQIVEFSLGAVLDDGSCDLDDPESKSEHEAIYAAFRRAGHDLQREAENLYSIEVTSTREMAQSSVHSICQELGAIEQSTWD